MIAAAFWSLVVVVAGAFLRGRGLRSDPPGTGRDFEERGLPERGRVVR